LGALAPRPLLGGTKGSHLVLESFPGAPDAAVYVEAASDGRPFFIIPWNGLYLIGTTDQRYRGDPGEAIISEEELRYLAEESRRVFPGIGDVLGKILYTQAGVRPLPYRPRRDESAITRRHIIRHHRNARGLYSVVGGKLTTHRALAEDVMARAARYLGIRDRTSPTRARALPGAAPPAERDSALKGLAARLGAAQAQRLWRIYGTTAEEINARIARAPELAREVCPHSHAMVAELIHAIEAEWAVSLIDVLQRRCMAGLSRDLGFAAADAAGEWLKRLTVWDAARAEQEIETYRAYAARFRVPEVHR